MDIFIVLCAWEKEPIILLTTYSSWKRLFLKPEFSPPCMWLQWCCAPFVWGDWQQRNMASLVNDVWLWLGVDLSPKLNLHRSFLCLSPLPTARHFCFHMADFSGNTLIFVAFGVGSRVCCSCQVFSLRLTRAPKLNCSVISCHPPPKKKNSPHPIFACNVKLYRWVHLVGIIFCLLYIHVSQWQTTTIPLKHNHLNPLESR